MLTQLPRTLLPSRTPRLSTRRAATAARPDVGVARAEFVRLHYAIEALRAEDRPIVLQFLAATPGEGTSTVATGFATVAAAERPHATLLVDCHGSAAAAVVPMRARAEEARPTLIEAFRDGLTLRAATWPDAEGLWRARLGPGVNPLLGLGGTELRALLSRLGESYATVALDCPAASVSPDGVALSRHCDGSVLVVRAAHARAQAVEETARALGRAGGQLLGCVLNRRRNHLPGWLERRL